MTSHEPLPARVVILAAIDKTYASEDVVRTSAVLAQTLPGAELHFVHVIEPMAGIDERNVMLSSPTEVAEGAAYFTGSCAERARAHFAGRIVSHIAAGTAFREILQLAANLHADLIVVGSHQRKGVERWLLGSVSEQVVRKASCAVLVARPKDYHAVDVPEIEPACTDCLATQNATQGQTLWCAQHSRRDAHPHGHLHYQVPEAFAVGSMLLRPER